jgi:hypothetical protein
MTKYRSITDIYYVIDELNLLQTLLSYFTRINKDEVTKSLFKFGSI